MGKLQIHMMQAQAALFPFLEGCISLYKQKAETVFHWESRACRAWVPSSHPFSFHLREREVPFIQESPFHEPSPSWCFRALCYPASPCTQLLLIPSSLSSYPLHDLPYRASLLKESTLANSTSSPFPFPLLPTAVWPLPQAPTETTLAGDHWHLWLGQVDPFQSWPSDLCGFCTTTLIPRNVLSILCGSRSSGFSSYLWLLLLSFLLSSAFSLCPLVVFSRGVVSAFLTLTFTGWAHSLLYLQPPDEYCGFQTFSTHSSQPGCLLFISMEMSHRHHENNSYITDLNIFLPKLAFPGCLIQ